MDIQQTATPVSSQGSGSGSTSHSPVSQARVAAKQISNNSDPKSVSTQPDVGMTRTPIQEPVTSRLDRRFQIKLLDLCTEYQGIYYQSELMSEFWDMIADTLDKQFRFPFPLTGKNVEVWVEGICREAKVYLTQGVAFPRHADHEDLNIAIEDWLEVEGRRKLQKGAAEMRMGYIFAFGPERSAEENLLADPCLHSLRENADKIKTAVSEKGKAICKRKIRLVQKIETLAPKQIQKPATAEHPPGSGNGRSVKLIPVFSFKGDDITTCSPDHDRVDDVGIGTFNMDKAATQKSPSINPEASNERYDTPHLSVGFSPARGPSPLLGALSPIKTPVSKRRTNTSNQKTASKPARQSCTNANTPSRWLCSSPSADRKYVLQASEMRSKKSPARDMTNADSPSPRESVKANSNRASGRSTSVPPPPSSQIATTAASSSMQDQQQEVEGGSTSIYNLRSARQGQPGPSPEVVPPVISRKGKGKRRSTSQVDSPNKIHRTRYPMSSPLPTSSKAALEHIPDYYDDGDHDQAPSMSPTPSSNHSREPPAPSTVGRSRTPCSRQDANDMPARIASGAAPIIDLTQSPVKKEGEEEGGAVFGNLGGRLISQLTNNLHGAVGLTEHIKEIVGRTISQSLEEFERRAIGRLDGIQNDLRALEDSRNNRS
ncbi:hypothetical protein GGR53DRAFT_451104 [Hypoxylon sp. FL1150]|nr:hypothetical protein GGR53DRAFT_451104 [Hypoxylon sp. FL1150]